MPETRKTETAFAVKTNAGDVFALGYVPGRKLPCLYFLSPAGVCLPLARIEGPNVEEKVDAVARMLNLLLRSHYVSVEQAQPALPGRIH